MTAAMRLLATAVIALVQPLAATAAPPTLEQLFPAGARRGTTVEVTATGTFAAWPVAGWCDARGVSIRCAKEKGKLTVTVPPDAVPGVHWLRLHDREGASQLRPFLIGTLAEVVEKEPNDDPKKPHALAAPGVVVNGLLEKAGDIDVFAVPLRKGQTLVASLEAQHTLRSPMDAVMQVLSPDGFVREQNNDFYGLDPHVVYTAVADGTYLVRLFAFPSVPDASVRFSGGPKFIYRLTLTTGPFADYAYPPAVAHANPGAVELVGWNLPDSLRRLPVVPAGEDETATLWHAELPNSVTVQLQPGAVVLGPQKLSLPITAAGKLWPEKNDVYPFEAKKGQKLSFRIVSRALGLPLEPVLRVTDAEGKLIGSAQAKTLGSDPTLDVAVAQDGSYRIEVADLHQDGGPRHAYLLEAGPPADYSLKVASDRFTMVPGKPLDIPVTVERRGGHTAPIELSAEDLPDGVGATTAGDQKGKTLTLRLEGAKGPFSGPLRIVGRSAGVPARQARAPLTELSTTSPHLWLSVAASK